MARIKQGILGGFSGKIGNIVGSSWKGIAVMKTLPLSVSNPRTAKQVAQRGYFSESVELAQTILVGIIKPLWDRFAVKQSGFNHFLQQFIKLRASSDLASKVKMAMGQMDLLLEFNASATANNHKLALSWTDDSGSGLKLPTDEIYCLVLDSNLKHVAHGSNIATRKDETAVLTLPDTVTAGMSLNVYAAARRADGTVVSDTNYASIVVAAS